jgi:acyl-coenzyme A synthetase/AMP-(fatty) acid ligase
MPTEEKSHAPGDDALRDRGGLWFDARALAPRLPDRPYLFNLCEDRYRFCATLLAALSRRQVCLLPPSSKPGVLEDIAREFPDCGAAVDPGAPRPLPETLAVELPETGGSAAALEFDERRTALIAFTSGTSGRPKACPKTWAALRTSAVQALASLDLRESRLLVVCTTPPQHMYGLETSIVWPLFSALAVHPGRPFFPEDIRRRVRDAPRPCLLVSTPTHLRALAGTEGEWTNLRGILCSTASLSETLARRVEAVTGAAVREIYGSTETLSFASRAPARETLWRPYRGASVRQDGASAWLASPHLERPVSLQDRLRVEADGRFEVLGRPEDLVKIGGKRCSLADLNRRLTDIPGVADGLLWVAEDERGECRTVAAVAGSAGRADILRALGRHFDDVFLPKRIHRVPNIPRNAVGKVVRAELEDLLESLPRDLPGGL